MLYFKKNIYQKCKQYIHLPNFENIYNLLIESVLPIHIFCTHQFSSVTQSCLTLHGPRDCSTPGFPVHHQLTPRAYSNSCPLSQWCHPNISSSVIPFSSYFQSLPASGTFPVSQLFASGGQSWSFSFSISLSNEYSGLVSFRMDWLALLAVQGTLKSSPTPQFESINSLALSFLYSPTQTSIQDYWKNHSLH